MTPPAWRPPTAMNMPLLVQPIKFGYGSFDLGPGAERVLAWVDIVAAGEAGQDLGASVARALGPHVKQRAAARLQRVADVTERRPVREDDLPVGAGAADQLPRSARDPRTFRLSAARYGGCLG